MRYWRSYRDVLVLALLAALVLAVVVGFLYGPKFRLQAIEPESVPAEVRAHPPAPEGATNVVWRDYHEEAGWYIAAVTYEMNTPSPSGRVAGWCYGVAFYALDAEGKLHYEGASGAGLRAESFAGGGGERTRGSTGTSPGRRDINAHGKAFHPQAVKVVGTTSTGRMIECRVVNGFWGLLVIDAESDERWTSVNAVDKDGRVLFQYWDGEHWQVGNG